MRVVHVHRIAGVGGSERHLVTLLPALAERGVEVEMLGLDDPRGNPEPFYESLRDAGIPFARVPSPRDIDLRLVLSCRRAIARSRPDLVHTHLVHADLYGGLAAVATRTGLVSTKHNDDAFRAAKFRFVERLLSWPARRIVCITEALAGFNEQLVRLPAEKLRVVHYGLDAPPRPWGGPTGPELPADSRVLVAVSRLERQKGVDVAIRALASVRREHPAAQLVVLGEGSLRSELAASARGLGVADAVHLPGRVGDVAAWLRRAELLVHPARWEGFGLALLEAMLTSTPVVGSAVSSIPEIVVDGETGILVPPDDPEQLAAAISRLLDDPDQAAAMGRAGLARARASFSVEQMAERTIAVYEEALAA